MGPSKKTEPCKTPRYRRARLSMTVARRFSQRQARVG